MRGVWLACLFLACGCRAGVVMDVRLAPGVAVAEPDALMLLESRVREADEAGLFEAGRRKAKENFRRLAGHPVELGLAKARTRRVSERLLVAGKNLPGGAAAEAVRMLSRVYLFIDAGDPAQRRWAKRELDRFPLARIVATAGELAPEGKGDPLKGVRLFADQGGILVRRFEVRAVPSRAELSWAGAGVVLRLTEDPAAFEDSPTH